MFKNSGSGSEFTQPVYCFLSLFPGSQKISRKYEKAIFTSLNSIDQISFRSEGTVLIFWSDQIVDQGVYISHFLLLLLASKRGDEGGGVGVREGGNQLIMSNINSTTHFCSEKE
jgi:hypothetical protein